VIDKIRAEFPGSKITYLKIGDLEYGEKTDPSKCVTPNLDYEMSRDRTKQKRAARTVGEKRRLNTQYKE